ncbi:hypothetical protein CHS0354_003234 [Potamilus streckersoni]|uniref:Uncharacterized protein n=1 Tax=Potamilus streckersoni TaxID=2493646 RepID=A0AAE0RYL0_9BIVA|nr:hypothetical protein CHS0354_003234 [Potamilus streckersoni]
MTSARYDFATGSQEPEKEIGKKDQEVISMPVYLAAEQGEVALTTDYIKEVVAKAVAKMKE